LACLLTKIRLSNSIILLRTSIRLKWKDLLFFNQQWRSSRPSTLKLISKPNKRTDNPITKCVPSPPPTSLQAATFQWNSTPPEATRRKDILQSPSKNKLCQNTSRREKFLETCRWREASPNTQCKLFKSSKQSSLTSTSNLKSLKKSARRRSGRK